jgi:hypothetical protein
MHEPINNADRKIKNENSEIFDFNEKTRKTRKQEK